MEQDYTANKIIQFIYGEAGLCDRLELEYAIATDKKTEDSYIELYTAYRSLEKVRFSPSRKSIDKVLEYASRSQSATA